MRNKRLATIWTKHIKDPKEKQEFEEMVRNSTILLDKLRSILKERRQGIQVSKVVDYDSLGWPYKRADRDGQLRVLNDLLHLLDF